MIIIVYQNTYTRKYKKKIKVNTRIKPRNPSNTTVLLDYIN